MSLHQSLEFTVLLAFKPDEVITVLALSNRVPHASRGSVASAVSHLLAERSVRRIKHGVYRLTDRGQAKQNTGPTNRAS